jgi:cytoskeletal protein RodZ
LTSARSATKEHVSREKTTRKTHEQKKRPTLNDSDESTPDSSADEELVATKAVNIEDYTYSYDAPRGPASGIEILEMAMNKAVERFEDKATLKLVHDEYVFRLPALLMP